MADPKTVQFEAFHTPPLPVGRYTLKQQVTLDHGASGSTPLAEATGHIEVTGPRFVLPAPAVYAVFPPEGSHGAFDNVLPHVTFARSTLPWERESGTEDATHAGRTPWMALLVVDDVELAHGSVSAQTATYADARTTLGLDPELGEADLAANHVTVLSCDARWLARHLPTGADLRWLTHVRVTADDDGAPIERTTLVANRLPAEGRRSHVHLVTLEGQLGADGVHLATVAPAEGARVSLVSLRSWSFSVPDESCFKVRPQAVARIAKLAPPLLDSDQLAALQAMDPDALHRGHEAFTLQLVAAGVLGAPDDPAATRLLTALHIATETFKGLLDHVQQDLFRVDRPAGGDPEAAAALLAGAAMPVPHRLRHGGTTASWYRPPLVPTIPADDDLHLPVRGADDLLRFDTGTGMLDISYSAAWLLGRSLTLARTPVAQALLTWKRAHAHDVKHDEQRLIFGHLPFTDTPAPPGVAAPQTRLLREWFAGLELLHGIPFHYLVPDASYLPPESIRFFTVEPRWVEALLDGAFSLGRVSPGDRDRDAAHAEGPHARAFPVIGGFLLRSDVVSGWPGLQVEASDQVPADRDAPQLESTLRLLRRDTLSPDVMIFLFAGDVAAVDLHLPPEHLHFGLVRPFGGATTYTKELKHPSGPKIGEELHPADDADGSVVLEARWRTDAPRTLDVAHAGDDTDPAPARTTPPSFAASMRSRLGLDGAAFGSGDFGLQMIEGVPKVRFYVGGRASGAYSGTGTQ